LTNNYKEIESIPMN